MDSGITWLGRLNYRSDRRIFGIRQVDRLQHVYLVGKTGTGKSTLLAGMAAQDLHAGRGFALLDPHGDLFETLRAAVIPEDRRVVVFDVAAAEPLTFNPIERVAPQDRALAASGLLEALKKLWADFWGPRMEHILRNCFLTLLEQPEAVLGDVLRLLMDEDYRSRAVGRVGNAAVRQFWLKEYAAYSNHFRTEAIAPIQNKVGAFLANPILGRILGQPKSSFDLRHLMDSGSVLLVNLSKGRLGEETSALLGSLLVSRIGLAALGRASVPPDERRSFFLYLDEFHHFTTQSLAGMLAELRKYGVGLVLAHQYLGQLTEELRDAVLGSVGSLICFRLGPEDAEVLAREFEPIFREADLQQLPNHEVYLKLMIDGKVSQPFSATTLVSPRLSSTALAQRISGLPSGT